MSSRPDFAVLGYPVISMTAAWTHQGSKRNLLGEAPDAELAKKLSGEQAVTKETPPTFIFQTNQDAAVPAENSVHYYLALRQAGIPAEMHIFETRRARRRPGEQRSGAGAVVGPARELAARPRRDQVIRSRVRSIPRGFKPPLRRSSGVQERSLGKEFLLVS